jgi:hypothetical protein
MAEHPDISKGWCCDGRTWTEHAHADGECCQPDGRHPGGPRRRGYKRIAGKHERRVVTAPWVVVRCGTSPPCGRLAHA